METYVMILAGAALVIAIGVILLVGRLWSTLGELEQFIRETRRETTPILSNVDDVLQRAQRVTEIVEDRAREADHDVENVLENLTSITRDLRELAREWRGKLEPSGRWSSWVSTLLASGYQAFQKYRDKNQSKKGGHNDE